MCFLRFANYHGTSPAWYRSPTARARTSPPCALVGGVLTLTKAPLIWTKPFAADNVAQHPIRVLTNKALGRPGSGLGSYWPLTQGSWTSTTAPPFYPPRRGFRFRWRQEAAKAAPLAIAQRALLVQEAFTTYRWRSLVG